MRSFNALVVAAALLPIPTFAQDTAPGSSPRTTIVFDGSGSMWGRIDGRTKLEIAREALLDTLDTLSPASEIGLIAYGHRVKGRCDDIETLVPVGEGARSIPAIASAVMGIRPKGKTPLTDAVRRAAEELRYTEEAATVVLVTDGIETCEADPCALAAELEEAGIGFTAHIVGFGLTEDEGRQVRCLAENTGGRFILADDGEALADALARTVAAAPPEPEPRPSLPARVYLRVFDGVRSEGAAETLSLAHGNRRHGFSGARLLSPDGEPVDEDRVEFTNHPPAMRIPADLLAGGDDIATIHAALEDGPHTLELTFRDGPTARLPFEVTAGMEAVVDLEYALASVRPKLVHAPGGRDWGYGGSGNNYLHYLRWHPVVDGGAAERPVLDGDGALPPGEYEVRAKLGQAVAEQRVTLAPGERFTGEIVFDAALVTVHIRTPEGLVTERIESRYCAPDLVDSEPAECRGRARKRAQHVNVGEPLIVDAYRDGRARQTRALRRVTLDPSEAGGTVTLVLKAGERPDDRASAEAREPSEAPSETRSEAPSGAAATRPAGTTDGAITFYAYTGSLETRAETCAEPIDLITDFGDGLLVLKQRSGSRTLDLRLAIACTAKGPTLGSCVGAHADDPTRNVVGPRIEGPRDDVRLVRAPGAMIVVQDGEPRTYFACERESLRPFPGLGERPEVVGPDGPLTPDELAAFGQAR